MVFSIRDSLGLSSPGVVSLIGAGGKTSLMFRLARELVDSGCTLLSTTTTKVDFPSKEQSPVTLVAETAKDLLARAGPVLKGCCHVSAGTFHIPGIGKLKGFAPPVIDDLWDAGCFDWIIVEADGARQLPIKASDIHEPVIPSCTTTIVHVTGLDAFNTPLDDDHVHRSAIFSHNTGLATGSRVDSFAMAVSCVLEIQKAWALAGSDPATVVWLNKADDPMRTAAGYAVAAWLKKDRAGIESHLARQRLHNRPCLPDRSLPWPGRVVIASLASSEPVKSAMIL